MGNSQPSRDILTDLPPSIAEIAGAYAGNDVITTRASENKFFKNLNTKYDTICETDYPDCRSNHRGYYDNKSSKSGLKTNSTAMTGNEKAKMCRERCGLTCKKHFDSYLDKTSPYISWSVYINVGENSANKSKRALLRLNVDAERKFDIYSKQQYSYYTKVSAKMADIADLKERLAARNSLFAAAVAPPSAMASDMMLSFGTMASTASTASTVASSVATSPSGRVILDRSNFEHYTNTTNNNTDQKKSTTTTTKRTSVREGIIDPQELLADKFFLYFYPQLTKFEGKDSKGRIYYSMTREFSPFLCQLLLAEAEAVTIHIPTQMIEGKLDKNLENGRDFILATAKLIRYIVGEGEGEESTKITIKYLRSTFSTMYNVKNGYTRVVPQLLEDKHIYEID